MGQLFALLSDENSRGKVQNVFGDSPFAIILTASATACAQQKQITAREVVARIQEQIGIPWKMETVDTSKAGNPDVPVTRIAVTMMATMEVLQRASAHGLRPGSGRIKLEIREKTSLNG